MALRQEVAVPKGESQRSANHGNATVTVRTITTVGDEPGSETRHGEDVAASSHTPSRVGTPGSVEYDHPRSSTVPHRFFGLPGIERTRFPWTLVWANEAGRSDGIGDGEEGFGRGGGGGDGGGGAERGTARAVECARENGDRAPAAEGRGARDGLAGDPGAGTRAGAVAADLPRGRDERLQAARQSGGGTRAEAGTGEGRRTDDEARDRGVVPRKKRLRGGV